MTRFEKRVAKMRKEHEAKVKARDAGVKKTKDTTKDKAVEK